MSLYKKWQKVWKRKSNQDFLRKLKNASSDKEKVRKSVAAFTALTIMSGNIGTTLAAVDATNIIRSDRTVIAGDKGVYNVDPFKVVGDNAFNSFTQFDLAANNVANMNFSTANNLFNFVHSQINIDGTLNAIKNNKIGGNLYFLSNSGMVVGSTGVINTGSLYVMTPTAKWMLKNDFMSLGVSDGFEVTANNLANDILNKKVPLNSSGTITVAGTVNATNNIGLYASKITIGAENNVNQGKIQTGVTDFKNLVNINSVNSGLTGELTATVDAGSGDIVLKAVSDGVEIVKSVDFSKKDIDFASIDELNKMNAEITNYGTISAKGNLSLEAFATNGEVKLDLNGNEVLDDNGNRTYVNALPYAKTNATINFKNGSSTTGNNVAAKATAENVYIDDGVASTAKDLAVTALGAATLINADIDFAVLDSTAKVNVEKGAEIKAVAGSADLKAKSLMDITVGASTAPIRLKGYDKAKLPAASTVIVDSDNLAQVTVDGKVSATKDINISAESNSSIDANTSSSTIRDDTPLTGALNLVKGTNTAKVDITSADKIKADENFNINSKSVNSLVSNAAASSSKGAMVTTVNLVDYNSNSKITINNELESGKDLNIKAENTFADNSIVTGSKDGSSKLMSKATNAVLDGFQGTITNIKGLLGLSGEDTRADFFKMLDKASVGASVSFAKESNYANIELGSKSNLLSGGQLNINALMNMQDIKMQSFSDAYSKPGQSLNLMGAIAFLGTDISNNAEVRVVEGAKVVSNAGNININSQVKMEYNRVQKMIQEVENAVNTLKNTKLNFNLDKVNKAKDNVVALTKEIKDNGILNEGSILAIAELTEALTELQVAASEQLADGMDSLSAPVKGALDLLSDATAFASPTNYVNFNVRSAIKSGLDPADNQIGLAGSLATTKIANNSKIIIERKTEINANKKLTIEANNNSSITGFGGNMGSLIPIQGTGNSLGGTMLYQDFDNSAVVAVAEGSKLSGGDIAVNANNKVLNVTGALSAGKGDSTINGMVSYNSGSTNALVSIDDEVKIQANKSGDNKGLVNVGTDNDNVVVNLAGAVGVASGASVGAGVAINDFSVNNIAKIADNDTDELTALLANGGTNDLFAKNILTKDNNLITISGAGIGVNAGSSGIISSNSIAAAVSKKGDSGEEGFFDKLGKKVEAKEDAVFGKVTGNLKKVDDVASKGLGLIAGKLGKDLGDKMSSGNTNQGGGTSKVDLNENANKNTPSFSLGLAGSASVNLINNKTEANVDGAKIDLSQGTSGKGDLSIAAVDKTWQSAASGAATIQWLNITKSSTNSTSVALNGAVAVNKSDIDTNAYLKNSIIDNVDNLNVEALSGGGQVAAGLGLAVTKSSGSEGQSYSGGASVSLNLIEHNVNALAEKNTVTGTDKGKLDVTAYESDVTVTGGVNISAGKSNGMAGAAVTVAKINNNVNAEINGGKYTKFDSVDTKALLAGTQVTAALSAGINANSSGTAVLEGAFVYNEIDNNLKAHINNNANITASGTTTILSRDVSSSAALVKLYQDELNNGYGKKAEDAGIDTTGKSYYKDLDTSYTTDGKNKETTADLNNQADAGSVIVTAGAAIAGTNGKAAAGASVVVDKINNNFTAEIDNATVSSDTVDVLGKSNALVIGASFGIGAGSKFGGAGAASWQQIGNTVMANVNKGTLTTNNFNINGDNETLAINLAGQVSFGSTAGVGASLAYLELDNATKAQISGSTVENAVTNINAKNKSLLIDLGVGASVATSGAAINGLVAANRISNTGFASADSTTFNNSKDINVKAQDDSNIITVAAGLTIGNTAAVGGSIAYSDIGGASTSAEKAGQVVSAKITNSTIKSSQTGTIAVEATDNGKINVVSVGVGGAGDVAVQGAASSGIINKKTEALLTNTNIDDATGSKNNEVNVVVNNNGAINNGALVIAGSGTAAIGAGVAVNNITQNTTAAVSGGKQEVNDLNVRANTASKINNIGVGGAGAGTVGIAGSVAVNLITSNTTAQIIGNAETKASGNIGVVAQNDEAINNYAGVISGAGTVAAGIAASVNSISGDTKATIEDSKVSAKGSDNNKVSVNDGIDDSKIYNNVVQAASLDLTKSLKDDRQTKQVKGLVVNSSATHTVNSTLANIAGSGTVAVTGTSNLNNISGATKAEIKNSEINKLTGSYNSDLAVTAKDYSNSAGLVGSVAGTVNAAIGAAADTNIMSRNTEVNLLNNKIKANDMIVFANSKQGISSLTVGITGSGIGASITGTASIAKLSGATKVDISNNSEMTVNSLDAKAEHLDRISMGGISVGVSGVGAGIGAVVGVVNEDSNTTVNVGSSNIDSANAVKLNAINNSNVLASESSGGAAIAGVSGAFVINNQNSITGAKVADSTIDSSKSNVEIKAKNNIISDTSAGSVAAGLAGVGVGVTVNTIDSSVSSEVSNSTLKATTDVTVSAEENRDITQTVANISAGGVAVGANVMVTGVGSKVQDSYKADGMDSANTTKAFDTSNSSINNTKVDNKKLMGAVDDKNLNDMYGDTTAGKGGDKNNSGANAVVKQTSTIKANTITVSSKENTDINMNSANVSAGIISANGTVGILDVKRNSGVNIDASTLDATNKLDIKALQSGSSNLNIYQGSGGALVGIGAAYGKANSYGSNFVNLNNSTLSGNSGVSINATDTSTTNVKSIGVTTGLISGSIIVSDADNNSNSEINIRGTNNISAYGGNLDISANKENEVTAKAVAGALGYSFAGVGVGATASDKGKAQVNVSDKNSFNSNINNKISIAATAKPAVDASTGAGAVSMVVATSISAAKATATAESNVTIGNNNSFYAGTTEIKASINRQDGLNTTNADMVALSGGGMGALLMNYAEANSATKANVNVGNNAFNNTGLAGDVAIYSENITAQNAQAKGLTIGKIFASGTNLAKTLANDETNVTVGSGSGNINNATIKSEGTVNNNATAVGHGGAAVDVSPVAAMVINNIDSKTNTNVNGSWATNGNLNIQALHTDNVLLDGNAVKAAIVGLSGVEAVNDIKNNSAVTLKDNIKLSSGNNQNIEAGNNVFYGKSADDSYTLQGGGYGGLNMAGSYSSNKIDLKAAVNAGNNNNISAYGDLKIQSYAKGEIYNRTNIKSAGVVAGTAAINENNITYDNDVIIGQNDKINSLGKNKNLLLSASDDTKIILKSTADTQGGAIGAATAKVKNTLTRNNNVDIQQGSKLTGNNDINIYAGSGEDGFGSKLDLQVIANAYNKTAAPISTNPKIDNTMYQNNQVSINGDVESVRHINLKASKGSTSLLKSANYYKWTTGSGGSGDITSTDFGDTIDGETTNNFVNIGGKLTAGIHNKLDITISGSIPENYDENTSDDVLYNNIKVEKPDWLDDADIKIGSVDYANGLMKRYKEVLTILADYSPSSDVYVRYLAEKNYLASQMKNLGFVEDKDIVDGEIKNISSNLTLGTIEIPDLVVSGGNVIIETDKLKGNSSAGIEARSANSINIINNSDLYLKINGLTISDKGGEVRLNNQQINTAEGFSTGSVKSDLNNTTVPEINILGNTNTSSKGVLADIGVYGNVDNIIGNVNIVNKNYNIAIMDGASISGKNISIIAEKGSVSQGYTEGIVNIGEDPIIAAQNTKNQMKNDANTAIGSQKNTKGNVTGTYTTSSDKSKGIQAGDGVYINAASVNINGYIQSGYAEYRVNLKESDFNSKIAAYDSKYSNNPRNITNSDLNSYKINDGGAKFDSSTNTYYYEVQAYYNPQTKQIVLEDVVPKGGQIYITGAIASTGNGRINAMDGIANISVNNELDRALNVGNIKNTDIDGLISITDTNKKTVTEYRKGSAIQYNFGSSIDKGTALSNTNVYNPLTGLRYQWTEGKSATEKRKYEYSKKFVAWGWIKYGTTKDFLSKISENDVTVSAPMTTNDDPLNNGILIGVDNSLSDNFALQYQKITDGDAVYSPVVADKHYSGWKGKLFGYGKINYSWTETSGTETIYNYSIKADNAINIGFIGSDSGSISLVSKNDLLLNGNISSAIKNNQAVGKVDLTSTNGAIDGSGIITTDNLNMIAAKGININHNTVADTANISAITNTGNISINSAASRTGGNINVAALTKNGNVNITAEGNIVGENDKAISIQGSRIDLKSEHGNIGSKGKALIIEAGSETNGNDSLANSINAIASSGDIVLTQQSGDMRLGKIDSGKDVVLTVNNGDFVDALPVVDDKNSISIESKIAEWKAMGLIDANGNSTSDDNKNTKMADLEAQAPSDSTKLKNIADQFSKDSAIISAKEKLKQAKSSSEQIIAKQDYDKAKQDFFNGKTGLSTKEENWVESWDGVANSNSYGWNQNQLLYAIQDSVINAQPGHITDVSNPNISANNIKLTAIKGGIGADESKKVIAYDELQNLDSLKILATAKAGDLEWQNNNKQVVVERKLPIGVKLNNSGILNAEAKDNVYLAGATSSPIFIDNVTSNQGNVRLFSQNGIYSVDNTKAAIKAKDLVIESGNADIGKINSALITNLSGSLDANSGKSIYLKQINTALNIQNMAAGGVISLDSTNGIYSVSGVAGKDMGYINAGTGLLLKADNGNIGAKDNGLRVLGNDAIVEAKANGDIVLAAKKTGTLKVGGIESATGNNIITGEGNIEITAGQALGLNGVKAKAVSISAENDIAVNKKIVADNVEMLSNNGSLLQDSTNDEGLITSQVKLTAKNNIILENSHNTFSNTDINGKNGILTGNMQVKTKADNGLNINGGDLTVHGDIYIENLGQNSADINLNKGKIEVVKTNDVDGNISFTAVKGKVNNNTQILADKNINITGANGIENKKSVQSTLGDIVISSNNGNIKNNADIEAENKLTVATGTGDVESSGELKSIGGNIAVEATEGTVNLKKINANKDAKVVSAKGAINIAEGLSGTNLNVLATEGKVTALNLTSGADLNITTGTGDIESIGELKSTGGNIAVEATAEGDINLNKVNANKNISIKTKKGIINLATLSAGDNSIIKTTKGDVKIIDLESVNNVDISSDDGKISNSGHIKSSQKDVKVQTNKGDVKLNDIYAEKNATIGSQNGFVDIGLVNGENVRVIANDPDNGLKTGKVIAGKSYMVTGNNVDIGELKQRTGYENMLTFSPKGTGNGPINTLNLKNISVSSKYGLMIENLWAHKAEIYLDGDKFYLPEVKIIDVAHFRNKDTMASVYGTPPVREGLNTEIYFNPNTTGWMKLNFEGGKKVITDGVLLRNDNYYGVHNERFSGVNLTNEILNNNQDKFSNIQHKENDFSFIQNNILGNKSLIEYSNIDSLFAGMTKANIELNTSNSNGISLAPEEVELNF